MDTVTIAQVYAAVKDALDYSGKRWTDQEVKEFVDRFLAKEPQTPDPKGCVNAEHGYCHFKWSDSMAPFPCVGLDACRKDDMLLGVKL